MIRRLIVVTAVVVALPAAAIADPVPVDNPPDDSPDLAYLVDGGALPFIWGALGARLVLDHFVEPPETPRLFSADEGGAPKASWEVPGWSVSLTGAVTAAAMVGGGDASRWYHVKGLAESLSTGVLLTGVLKTTFGRHRPDWDPAIDTASSRQSFPSGHATQAFAVATYSILYLRTHVFDRDRTSALSLGEGLTYGAILATATALAGERVYHDRHHVMDVVAGAALGTASSALFFWYQERRFRHAHRERDSFTVMPSVTPESVSVRLGWTF